MQKLRSATLFVFLLFATALSAQNNALPANLTARLQTAFSTQPQQGSEMQCNVAASQNAPVFHVLNQVDALKKAASPLDVRNQQPQFQALALDTLIVGGQINDTLIITGNWTHTGPIWVLNNGVLIFDNATVIDTGDVYVFGNGQWLADSSSFFFPQNYIYERSFIAVQNAYVRFSNSSFNYSGFSHSLVVGSTAVVEWNNVHQNDWTTCGMYGSGTMHINGCNLSGEYILQDTSSSVFEHADSIILWHQFPETAVVNYAFPNGSTVYNYNFDNTTPGITGIDYNVNVDSCNTVWWAIMPVNGSDVTLSSSDVRLIGAWFERGDTTSAFGIFNNSSYVNYTAPLNDRNLHLINSTVQTWSMYVFDSSMVVIDSCQLGEVGTQQRSFISADNLLLDGSGGYFWATDSSVTFAVNSICYSMCRSEKKGTFVLAYSWLPFAAPTAVHNSTLICVQNNLVLDPVPYDGSVIWMATMEQPDTAVVNSSVAITGSAWIDQGPLGNPIDFSSYSLYYQLPSQSATWFPIVQNATTEVVHSTLANWNTLGLQPGTYIMRLTLYANTGDSVEGFKIAELLPNSLGVPNTLTTNQTCFVYPNPTAGVFTIHTPEAKGELQLYNALGLLVYNSAQTNTGNYRIDLSDEAAGVYFWVWKAGDGRVERGRVLVGR